MRILFLCSCLEPGRDGVGDYVRLLAHAAARQGHACGIAALNDPRVEAPGEAPDGDVATLRLPSSLEWAEREKMACRFRDKFHPDWISLQLVPYAFQKRGILFGLDGALGPVTEGVPLHLMFHELWLGAGRPSPLRFYLTGFIQRLALARLIAGLRPKLVTASNPVHVAMLRELGTEALMLPLFGNVPITSGDFSRVAGLWAKAGITPENRREWWVGLFFGSLHPEWKSEPFLSRLETAALAAGKKICLVLAGRAGASGEMTWSRMEHDYDSRVTMIRAGEQPVEIISALLQNADFGIAASPWQLIGKSGTVAAMLDHGLPVLVTREDFQPFQRTAAPPSTDPLVHRCDERLEAKLIAGLPKRAPRAQVDGIAAQLCARLAAFTPGST
jgi:hypothetical protein